MAGFWRLNCWTCVFSILDTCCMYMILLDRDMILCHFRFPILRTSYFGFWISSVWTAFCCQFGHVNADIFSGIFMSNNDD